MAVVKRDGNLVLVRDAALFEAAAPAAPVEEVEPSQTPEERTTSVKPDDVEWDEWSRRQDTIRSAAREFDQMDHGDIREFLTGKVTRDLTDDEVGQIKHDIEAQRILDLTEIFDSQLRTGPLKRGRRTVSVTAPRGWTTRAFNSLSERQVEQLAARLISRGHDEEKVTEKVVNRVKDEEARTRILERFVNGDIKIEFSMNMNCESDLWQDAEVEESE